MGFIYGLAVLLIIFEGIIIQCEGGAAFSSNRRPDPPRLPNDLIELILSKTDFRTIHQTIREKIIHTTDIAMSGILQSHIILTLPGSFQCEFEELNADGDFFLRIGDHKRFLQFFERFGDQVKKVAIWYSSLDDGVQHKEINENIIKKYATNFEELRIMSQKDGGLWEEISNGKNDIIFPKLKKLQIRSDIKGNNFKMNLIFPKLECLNLFGGVKYENCLEYVKGLKELMLCTHLINDEQLDDIFANNENLTMIRLTCSNRTETMHSIAKHLTKLKTLEVISPGVNVLSRANNNPVYTLPSVNHFIFQFYEMGPIIGIGNLKLSFDMPHLKKLTMAGSQGHHGFVNFIKHFKELETVELLVENYNAIKCIEKLEHIKEFTTIFYEDEFDSLKTMFHNFDKESKLQTLYFVHFPESLYRKYEKKMKKFNNHLEKSKKPRWTLSLEERVETRRNYLVFRREPCECESFRK